MITEVDDAPRQEVSITGIHVPFWSVVGFMVKWSIAAIPALFILAVIEIVAFTAIVAAAAALIHYYSPGSFGELLRSIFGGPFSG